MEYKFKLLVYCPTKSTSLKYYLFNISTEIKFKSLIVEECLSVNKFCPSTIPFHMVLSVDNSRWKCDRETERQRDRETERQRDR